MATQSWLDVFNEVSLTNLDFSSSDHSPLFLLPEITAGFISTASFRYENAWQREPLCHQIVSNVWYSNPTEDIMGKIVICGKQLADWGRNLTGNFKSRLKKSKKLLAQFKNFANDFDAENFMVEKNNYFKILAQQELYWKQRSKQYRLHSGDKNNKYFHATASARRRSNQIQQLEDVNGTWQCWNTGIATVINQYFEELYQSTDSFSPLIIDNVRNYVTISHNEALLQSILDEEVKVVVFSMHPDKALGPDGMGPGFFQHHWDIVGSDVTNLVKEFFATEALPDGLNDTNLVLIPKKKNFITMSDLRPISLCNVLYKIISKVLANRMRDLIDCIISETQSAFIPGHLISDNLMVAFEVMHYLKRKKSGKKGFMALKLDTSKAYDRVEWSFLRAMMARMGFASKWIDLIMACVSTVRYRVVYNGHVLDPISPSRGIRQSDPLSTYLFIIGAEGLSALIQKFEANRLIQGCKVAQRAPPITHMFFANDSYLFSQATQGAADSITNLLQLFENASGQKVNYSKSSIFFSPNTTTTTRAHICSILHMSEALEGKEILLKTVVQSMPTYAMSVFLLPIGTCNEIEKLMASFWWKTKSSNGRDFLSFDLGNNPSFVWRSIWGAKDLVQLGAARVIGDGKDTKIMGSPWLPSSSNKYVSSNHPGLTNHNVNSLLQTNTNCWDVEAVHDLFSPEEAELILSIPIGTNSRPDSWAWTADYQGNFTVQSAYQLLQSQKPVEVRPNNSGSLPTCVNLVMKHVPISSQCPVCQATAETTTHALLTCDFARSCWAVFGWPATIDFSFSFGHWFELLQNTNDKDFICRAATLCWALWKARNKVVWNKHTSTVKEVMATDDGVELWTPPATNNLKIDVDATLFPNDNSYGYGLVVRDHFGKFLEAKTSQFNGSYPAEVVEALRIKEALSWIKGKIWENMELTVFYLCKQ
ncbi:hypothetical protein CsatB_014342 [Cannabis sativa]|uniref:uncharacterized protein LOC115695139 n=1 Tax=Cannabis sativa TaxID=3483 RepID=UPI0029CA4BA6|nr:uncharacterized protein LOC115695139 [Cannabis sativa]